MMDIIVRWVNKPARWYEFWYPQSGILGGMLGAAIATLVAYLIFKLMGL